MIERKIAADIQNLLSQFPAVGIIGPRQVGKTTLARSLAQEATRTPLYLDLENPVDLAKLNDPHAFFTENTHHLIILDEIQRKPELFPVLRGIIDENRRNGIRSGEFLILGSASVDLLRQSSESLAGRISYVELTGLLPDETQVTGGNLNRLWLRGGFPDSYLAADDRASLTWRNSFITTYLERDIPQFGLNVPVALLRQLWTMLCHGQGTLINYSTLARNLDISSPSVSRYIQFLEDLFLVRILNPWHGNIQKRLIKTPKVYVRDSGILHALLRIVDHNDLLGHPIVGASWEGWVLENLLARLPAHVFSSFYRSAAGAEVDLVLESGQKVLAIEIKKSTAPSLTKGFYLAAEDIGATHKYLVHGGTDEFPLKGDVRAVPLSKMMEIVAKL